MNSLDWMFLRRERINAMGAEHPDYRGGGRRSRNQLRVSGCRMVSWYVVGIIRECPYLKHEWRYAVPDLFMMESFLDTDAHGSDPCASAFFRIPRWLAAFVRG